MWPHMQESNPMYECVGQVFVHMPHTGIVEPWMQ